MATDTFYKPDVRGESDKSDEEKTAARQLENPSVLDPLPDPDAHLSDEEKAKIVCFHSNSRVLSINS
jgi:hypothetical protein